jgi:hypothetical protein
VASPFARPAGAAGVGAPAKRRHAGPTGVGFEVGATTAWRYIREAVDLLAASAPTLAQAMAGIARLAYAILDGTLIRIDRLGGTANRRYYAGKPRHYAVNVQVFAD